MVKSPNRAASCSRYNEPRVHPSILSLETPKAEDIARAIWQRQRDALGPGAIAYNAEWRDQSIPSRFWDEFLLDAYAVLSLLYEKHIIHENTRCDIAEPWRFGGLSLHQAPALAASGLNGSGPYLDLSAASRCP